VENVISCPSCGGETPANVGVCLRCFTNLDAIVLSSEVPDVRRPPAEAAPTTGSGSEQPAGPVPDEEFAEGGPGLLFPTGWLPIPAAAPVQIGREDNDLVPGIANHGNVSRLHARIERSGEALSVTDLNSTNGTFLNGRRLRPGVPTEARPGDLIRFAADLEAIVDEDPEL
jgi:FHA domain